MRSPLPFSLLFLLAVAALSVTDASSAAAASARTSYPASSSGSAAASSSGWHVSQPASPDSRIDLLFALKHSPAQLSDLREAAQRVSDPASGPDSFRRYLSRSEVQRRFAPSKQAEEIVVAFLREQLGIAAEDASSNSNSNPPAESPLAGAASAAPADTNSAARAADTNPSSAAAAPPARATISVLPGGWVRATGVPVSQASAMLHTEFAVWAKHVSEDDAARQQPLRSATGEPSAEAIDHSSSLPLIRSAGGYSLPSDVAAHVDFVGGVTKLPTMRFQAQMVSSRRVHPLLAGGRARSMSSAPNDTNPNTNTNAGTANDTNPADASAPPSSTPGTPDAPGAPSSQIRFDQAYTVTPGFLRELYDIPADARGTFREQNRQALPQFLEQYFSGADLEQYLEKHDVRAVQPTPAVSAQEDSETGSHRPDSNDSGTNPFIPLPSLPPYSQTPTQNISRVRGPNDPLNPGGEASLDTQLALGLAPGVLTEVWSFPGRRDNSAPPSSSNQEPFLDWLVLLSGMDDPPLVHSVSYADDEKDCTEQYMARLDAEFQKAALRGISILFASGDDGAGSVDSRTDLTEGCRRHNPNFPSSSPWITSVGGTQLGPAKSRSQSPRQRGEIVSSARTGSAITTGGGFSHFFPRPSYQARAVQGYLDRAANASASSPSSRPILPPSDWFNASGRSYPDLAVLATNYEIIVGGRAVRTGGTSASCPVVAAMVSLLNEHQLSRGRPPVGFLNPWLYRVWEQHGKEVFNDVVSGQ